MIDIIIFLLSLKYSLFLDSVVNLILNIRNLNVEELSEDLAKDLAELEGVVGDSGVLSVLHQSQHLKAIRVAGVVIGGLSSGNFTIKVEDLESLDDNGGSGVETTREGVNGAADSDNQVIKIALTIIKPVTNVTQ